MADPTSMRPRMLVVDDEDAIRFGLKTYFTIHGYEVECARDVEEAEAQLNFERFAILIVDLRLSGRSGDMEGLGIIEYARVRFPWTRIVVLTASASPDVERRALQLGADSFVVKPKPLPELADIVRGVLKDD